MKCPDCKREEFLRLTRDGGYLCTACVTVFSPDLVMKAADWLQLLGYHREEFHRDEVAWSPSPGLPLIYEADLPGLKSALDVAQLIYRAGWDRGAACVRFEMKKALGLERGSGGELARPC